MTSITDQKCMGGLIIASFVTKMINYHAENKAIIYIFILSI